MGAGFSLPVPAGFEGAGELTLGLRPQDLRVAASGPFSGTVEAIERLGFDGYAFLKTAAGPLAARFEGSASIAVGDAVSAQPVGDALHVFTADGRQGAQASGAEGVTSVRPEPSRVPTFRSR